MKTLSGLFLFMLFSVTLAAQEATTPSAREIADAYIEATGGKDAWMAVKATKTEGKVSMQGMEFPITMFNAEGNKMRMDIDIQGSPMTQAYNGETARMLFPMQGINEPKTMTDEEAADFKDTYFLSEFINSEERGFTLTSVEGKEIEGSPTYGVQVTNDDGFDHTYYFDTETMVPLMMSGVSKGGQMKGMMMENYFSDYEEVDGLVMPMFFEQKVNGQTAMKFEFTDVSLNPEIKEGFFDLED